MKLERNPSPIHSPTTLRLQSGRNPKTLNSTKPWNPEPTKKTWKTQKNPYTADPKTLVGVSDGLSEYTVEAVTHARSQATAILNLLKNSIPAANPKTLGIARAFALDANVRSSDAGNGSA